MNAHEADFTHRGGAQRRVGFFYLAVAVSLFCLRTLAAGMAVLAAERVLSLLALQTTAAVGAAQLGVLQRGGDGLASLPLAVLQPELRPGKLPGFLAKWKWPALAVSLLPFLIGVFFGDSLFARFFHFEASSDWVLRLGWSGYTFTSF